jgi:hypothetical protein
VRLGVSERRKGAPRLTVSERLPASLLGVRTPACALAIEGRSMVSAPHADGRSLLGAHGRGGIVEVHASGEIALVKDQGLPAVVFRLGAVPVLVVPGVDEMRCTGREHAVACDITVITQRDK